MTLAQAGEPGNVFRARSYTRVLIRAASDLLSRLQRKSDPQAWQQGTGCRDPQTRDVAALLTGWSPFRTEVRRRFRKFPRLPEPIIRRLVFEIGIVEGLISEQRDQNTPADGDQDDSRPSDSLSDRASERVSISTGRSARLTRNEELIIRTLQKKGHRMTTMQILQETQAAEGPIKATLSSMVAAGAALGVDRRQSLCRAVARAVKARAVLIRRG